MKNRTNLLLIFMICIFQNYPSIAKPLFSHQYYGSSLVKLWSEKFSQGDFEEQLSKVNDDLRSSTPQVNSPFIWSITHMLKGDLKKSKVIIKDSKEHLALGDVSKIVDLYYEQKYDVLLKLFPPQQIKGINDPWSFFLLASAARKWQRWDLLADYSQILLLKHPNWFGSIWNLAYGMEYLEVRQRAEKLIQHNSLKNSSAAHFLSSLLETYKQHRETRYFAVTKWLKKHPKDALALRFRAHQLYGLKRYSEAQSDFETAYQNFPFLFIDGKKQAQNLIRLQQFNEAKGVITKAPKILFSKEEEKQKRKALIWAEALIATGERGRARKHLARSISQWPNTPDFQIQLAKTELASQRYQGVIDNAKQALQLNPTHVQAYDLLIEGLYNLERYVEVISTFHKARTEIKNLPFNSYWNAIQSMKSLGQHNAVNETLEEAVAIWPQAPWFQYQLANVLSKKNKTEDALNAYLKTFEIKGPTTWGLSNIYELLDADHNKLTTLRSNLRSKFNWSPAVWLIKPGKSMQSHSPNERQKQIELFEKAAMALPKRAWPYERVAIWSYQVGNFKAGQGFAQKAFKIARSGTEGELVSALDLFASGYETQDKAAITPTFVREWLLAMDRYDANKGNLSLFHERRTRLFLLADDLEQAAQSAVSFYQLSPDKHKSTRMLFAGQLSPYLSNAEGFVALNRYLERDPWQGDRLALAAHFHSMWGGSPVVAIKYYELLRERDPDVYVETEKQVARAYGRLGAYQELYRRIYHNSTGVGNSERYVGWFAAARQNAQNQETELLELDLKNNRAVLFQNGIEVEFQDDPVTGRRLYTRTGSAWLRVKYEKIKHTLSQIENSAGLIVSISYDKSGLIAKISANDDRVLEFKYGKHEEPIQISVSGVGDLKITYDQNGNIIKTTNSGGDHIARKIMSVFDDLQGLIQAVEERKKLLNIPELPYEDDFLNNMWLELDTKLELLDGPLMGERLVEVLKIKIKLVDYLIEHINDHSSYSHDVEDLLQEMAFQIKEADTENNEVVMIGLKVTKTLHHLLNKLYHQGVSLETLNFWGHVSAWLLEYEGKTPKIKTMIKSVREAIEKSPIRLQDKKRWLPNSPINNPGFWRRFSKANVIPKPLLEKAHITSILTRQSGDVVIGSTIGLSVLHQGYWHWYGFDQKINRFSQNMEFSDLKATSSILSLAETDDGTLWVGTVNGLHHLQGPYTDEGKLWQGEQQKLPSNSINHLVSLGEYVLAGTPKGLVELNLNESLKAIPLTETGSIKFLKKIPGEANLKKTLVGTEKGLFAYEEGVLSNLLNEKVNDIEWVPELEKMVILKENTLHVLDTKSSEIGYQHRYMIGQQDVVYAKKINSLELISLENGILALAVLTDRGISIYNQGHFEHVTLPLGKAQPAVDMGSAAGSTVYYVTSEGLYVFERGKVHIDTAGSVFAIKTDDKNQRTYIARHDRIEVLQHKKKEDEFQILERVHARHLELDHKNRLVSHDGSTVLRFPINDEAPSILFDIQDNADITSLLIASDGTVWVTAGATLYRWREDWEKPELYGIKENAQIAPFRSDMLWRVMETKDQKIWVVASNESHRAYNGIELSGGVFEWRDNKFIHLTSKNQQKQLLTSYTDIGDGQAILGSTKGFLLQERKGLKSFEKVKEPSYQKLLKQDLPMLFLGTKGVPLKDDFWLFGTAGGVVGYGNGQWFYPNRLNWMLPDDQLSSYGSRVVNAISSDEQGRIYLGTDRGLTIYDPRGEDSIDFLLSNDLSSLAFKGEEHRKLRQLSDVMLDKVSPVSPQGKLLKRINKSKAELEVLIEQVERDVSPLIETVDIVKEQKETSHGTTSAIDLKKKLNKKRKAHLRLLSKLEKKHRGLYQMLELKPLDLVALSRLIPAKSAVVQYLPVKDKLYIHIVSRDAPAVIREVKIGKEELYEKALSIASVMSKRPFTNKMKNVDVRGFVSNQETASNLREKELPNTLSWLYEKLLRPIEHDLTGMENVFIVSSGPLTYLPYAALTRQTGAKTEYAVERFNIGYLPSMYLLDLVLRHEPSISSDALVFGNPDGTLPGAEREAKSIYDKLESSLKIYIGEDATYENLVENIPDARLIHLATHAVLNGEDPMNSYVVLAQGKRLSIIDAALLDLSSVDLIVLSACESGVGASGLEFATLARSFSHAGAASVVATLWRINDTAAASLMDKFYEGILEEKSIFRALAEAQRSMIGKFPIREWAAFIPFGKP